MGVKDDINKTIEILKKQRLFKSQNDIASHLGYNVSYFSRTMNEEVIPMDFEDKFFKAFPKFGFGIKGRVKRLSKRCIT